MEKIIEELKEFKEKSGWSYYKIATRLGVHPQSVRNWCKDKAKPTPLAKEKIQDFLIRTI